jgi:FtsZ-interacting cell division protein ZipA
MDPWMWIVIAIVIVGLVAAAAWAAARARRTETLRDRFGPEYDRTLMDEGGRHAGESELRARVERHDELDLRPISAAAAERYMNEWRSVQARFVDTPAGALDQADALITSVMRDRGYPMDEFDQRAADLSVDHPEVVEDYRAAHAIALANERGDATTEDLRQAMVHFRSLFERLVEVDTVPRPEGARRSTSYR